MIWIVRYTLTTCRRVAVLHEGKLIADGSTDGILGDANLMLRHSLAVPYSLEIRPHVAHDHRHGTGISHGDDTAHDVRQHRSSNAEEA